MPNALDHCIAGTYCLFGSVIDRLRSVTPTMRLGISVIVCTMNRRDEVHSVVRSLAEQTRPPDELVIVDAGSIPELDAQVKAIIGERIPFLYVHSAPGLTRQRNVGVARSHGDLLLFLDDDVVLDTAYVAEVAGVFERDGGRSIAAVQGRITECSRDAGSAEDAARLARWRSAIGRGLQRVFLLWGTGQGRLKRSGFAESAAEGRDAGPTPVLNGCACFRRDVFGDVRFDERLDGYAWMEDVDMSRQLAARGYQGYYQPAARLWHHHTSTSRTPARRLGRMMVFNHHYLYRKHADSSFGDRLAFAWSCLGLLIHAASRGELSKALGLLDGYRIVLRRQNPLLLGRD